MTTLDEYIKANQICMPIWIDNNIDRILDDPLNTLQKYYRQFAHGLKDYPKKDVKNVLGCLYSRLYEIPVVFGGLGNIVDIDNREFIKLILEAMKE